jgi:hypothetical protein
MVKTANPDNDESQDEGGRTKDREDDVIYHDIRLILLILLKS